MGKSLLLLLLFYAIVSAQQLSNPGQWNSVAQTGHPSFSPASNTIDAKVSTEGRVFHNDSHQDRMPISKVMNSRAATALTTEVDNGSVFWQQANGPYGLDVTSIVINSSGDVFAGTSGGGVYLSTNNGSSWTQVNSGLTNTTVLSLAINTSGNIFAGIDGGVCLSTNKGSSWTEVNNGLRCATVWSLAINSSGYIFAATDEGVYLSTNNGNNWTQVNRGLTNTVVFALAINSSGNIFAGTVGGVFRSINSTTDVKTQLTIPKEFVLLQNYPNPFNPGTVISYLLPENGFVTLKVYDMIGREVKTLVNDRQTAGTHSVKFNAGNLSSGVYFYRLQAGNYVNTKKLMLIK
jgi:Secretion system C-terminal sorting domain